MPKPERDRAVAEVAETLQITPSARPQAEPALRRPAPARRHGPRAGAQPAGLPVRRAALQSRRQAARRHAHRDQAAASAMKTTIVYVTHDQIEAMTLATTIAVLKDGVLQQFGTPARDLQHARQYLRRRLHGLARDEPASRRGREERQRTDASPCRRDRARPLSLALADPNAALAKHAGGNVIFGIRPEAMTDPDGADRIGAQCRRPPTARSRWWSPRAPTPSPSPISAARRWWRGSGPMPRCMPGTIGDARLQSRQGGVLRSRDATAHRLMRRNIDYIIVGGGSAGCVLAARLSRGQGRDACFSSKRAAATAIRCSISRRASPRMTKGIASWGYSTVPQKHMQRSRVLVHAGQGDRRRLLHQRADLYARQCARLRRMGAGRLRRLELSRSAALLQARRGQ